MKQKSLTEDQIRILILALLGIEPYVNYLDPDGYDVLVTPGRVEPSQRADVLGVEVNFHISRGGKLAHNPIDEDYQLFIAHYATIQQINPSYIWLARLENDQQVILPLCNLALVTDKLREYSFW